MTKIDTGSGPGPSQVTRARHTGQVVERRCPGTIHPTPALHVNEKQSIDRVHGRRAVAAHISHVLVNPDSPITSEAYFAGLVKFHPNTTALDH